MLVSEKYSCWSVNKVGKQEHWKGSVPKNIATIFFLKRNCSQQSTSQNNCCKWTYSEYLSHCSHSIILSHQFFSNICNKRHANEKQTTQNLFLELFSGFFEVKNWRSRGNFDLNKLLWNRQFLTGVNLSHPIRAFENIFFLHWDTTPFLPVIK